MIRQEDIEEASQLINRSILNCFELRVNDKWSKANDESLIDLVSYSYLERYI